MRNAKAVFAVFDEYEGADFQREFMEVRKESGEVVEAFIYWFTGKTDKALLVEENSYLDYLKNKKDRFQ